MLIPGSVRVAGLLAPTDTTDTYAVTDEIYHRGGYRSVNTIVDRDSITNDRRKEGMVVHVIATNENFILVGGISNNNWLAWAVGGSEQPATPSSFSATIGNGVDSSFVIEHNLGTFDVVAQVRDFVTQEVVEVDIVHTTLLTTQITFAIAPAVDSYRVTIIG